MGDINEGKVNFPKKRFIDDVPQELLLQKGDLLFNRTNSLALVGKVGRIEGVIKDVTFASYLIMLRVKRYQCSRYYCYFLNSEYFAGYMRSNAIQTANQANISSSRLKQFKIIDLDYNLQKAIADYLDTKTTQFDSKIDFLNQKAIQYGKLKQSLIDETVTRGLDKTLKMKNSGVEWIGEVPEHWKNIRVKELFVESKRKSTAGEETLLSVSEYSGVTQKKDNIEEDELLTTAISLVGYKICKVDELVVNIMLALSLIHI